MRNGGHVKSGDVLLLVQAQLAAARRKAGDGQMLDDELEIERQFGCTDGRG